MLWFGRQLRHPVRHIVCEKELNIERKQLLFFERGSIYFVRHTINPIRKIKMRCSVLLLVAPAGEVLKSIEISNEENVLTLALIGSVEDQ